MVLIKLREEILSSPRLNSNRGRLGRVVVIGGANIDLRGRPDEVLIRHTSNLGRVNRTVGGVGRNIAHNLALLDVPVTFLSVVCAGAKVILDLPLTKEYLETMGVPVLGFRTEELPAFYCRDSGLKVDYVVNDEKEAAKVIETQWSLGLKGGLVIANPIPKEFALSKDYIDRIIEESLKEAEKARIKGKALTPFLLNKINELSEGKSLKANIELVKNNALVGAKIALELKK